MDTINQNNDISNLHIAKNYYHSILQKNFTTTEEYLHPNIHFIGPLATMSGKDSVISAAKNMSEILSDIKIRSRFTSDNQIMLACDYIFLQPIGKLRAAVLWNLQINLSQQ